MCVCLGTIGKSEGQIRYKVPFVTEPKKKKKRMFLSTIKTSYKENLSGVSVSGMLDNGANGRRSLQQHGGECHPIWILSAHCLPHIRNSIYAIINPNLIQLILSRIVITRLSSSKYEQGHCTRRLMPWAECEDTASGTTIKGSAAIPVKKTQDFCY